MKLRKLVGYGEPLGDFMAFVPGERRQRVGGGGRVGEATGLDRNRYLARETARGRDAFG